VKSKYNKLNFDVLGDMREEDLSYSLHKVFFGKKHQLSELCDTTQIGANHIDIFTCDFLSRNRRPKIPCAMKLLI
jgi:hypothetical protein